MFSESVKHLCIYNILDGLREGLTQYSGLSRAALIYGEKPEDEIRIYDPQELLRGHEPKLEELYLNSESWREYPSSFMGINTFGHVFPEENLQLAGLISFGGKSSSLFYQMWFTEHHPDMCSIGPTEKWLEHAVYLLSHDYAYEDVVYTNMTRYVLREYSTHAIRDYILDELNKRVGWDSQIWIYPILEAILGISKTREEGAWPRGQLVFIDARDFRGMPFLVQFPENERPKLENHKHVRKLLISVEQSERKLVSDGESIVGISENKLPDFRLTSDFRGHYGFLRLAGESVCSFADGSFHSTTHKANLVHLEESLLEIELDTHFRDLLFRITSEIVHDAGERKHGCTLVLDFSDTTIDIPGQRLVAPLDLQKEDCLDFAKSASKVDGALHIGADARLHGFACLLDGRSVPGENRARGARFNSALRFTAEHREVIVVVMSVDRPVSVIQGGVELTAQCEWRTFTSLAKQPPTLEKWIEG